MRSYNDEPSLLGVGAGAVPGDGVPGPLPLLPHVRGGAQSGRPQLCGRHGGGQLPPGRPRYNRRPCYCTVKF